MVNQVLSILTIVGGGIMASSMAIAQVNPPEVNAIEQCNLLSGAEALEACDRALALDPDNPILWMRRGLLLNDPLGRSDEALESHERALALAPNYSLALYNRCVVLIALERYEEAASSCSQALQGDGSWGQAAPSKAWMNRGLALRRLGRYNEALEAYNRAIELEPGYVLAWNNRGVVLLDIGRYREAESAFQQALELDPDNELVRRNLSIVQQQQR
ncbi:MAG: tetratricopeptide repeat protein [Cyanobacteriota bacterium]|nr:tetratricopeptide repeat protein [Cyanobacteriota bacterium]